MWAEYCQITKAYRKTKLKRDIDLSKLKCDIDYLLQCKRHNLIPTFARPKIAIQISNYLRNKISKQILEAELTNKYRKKKMLLRQIITNQNELKDRTGFIFYIAFASKINKSIRKKNGQKHTRKNLDIYLNHNKKTTKVKTRVTEKIIHNFSSYALSKEEKLALSYSLDEDIPVKLNENKMQTEFQSFYYNIMQYTGHFRQREKDQL